MTNGDQVDPDQFLSHPTCFLEWSNMYINEVTDLENNTYNQGQR